MEFCNISSGGSAKIFDTHAHYDDSRFDANLDSLMYEMKKRGVDKIINCGCDKETSLKSLEFAEKYPFVLAAVGTHPSNMGDTTISGPRKSGGSRRNRA